MDSPFDKSFDEILDGLLTDYRNQTLKDESGNVIVVDTSEGTLIFIKSTSISSALWGLYREQSWIGDQIFPDTADSANLEHHAWVQTITRTYGEGDGSLLARLLNRLRQPPAGGNQNDYEQWALDIDGVAAAYCIPMGQGLGTVDVIILANAATTGSEIPSSHAKTGTATTVEADKLIDAAATFQDALPVRPGDVVTNAVTNVTAKVLTVDSGTQLTLDTDIFTGAGQAYTVASLCAQVKAYIDSPGVRPVTDSVIRILPPVVLAEAVTMAPTGYCNKAQTAIDIAAYINGMIPGQGLDLDQLKSIAVANGAEKAPITAPAADIPATMYQVIRPGAISVS